MRSSARRPHSKSPPLPWTLPTDAGAVGCYQNRYHPFGYTDVRQIEALRKVSYSQPVNIARRDEILAAYDEWAAACHSARAATGIDASREQFFVLSNAASAIRRQMINARAMTIDDLWHKVAVVLECFNGTKGIEEEMMEEENQEAAGREMLGLSILLDLGRMLEMQDVVSHVEPDRRAVAAYRQWLDMESRLLGAEMYPQGGNDAHRFVPQNTAASHYHFPAGSGMSWRDLPQPMSRAEAMCKVLGIDWTTDEPRDERFLPVVPVAAESEAA